MATITDITQKSDEELAMLAGAAERESSGAAQQGAQEAFHELHHRFAALVLAVVRRTLFGHGLDYGQEDVFRKPYGSMSGERCRKNIEAIISAVGWRPSPESDQA